MNAPDFNVKNIWKNTDKVKVTLQVVYRYFCRGTGGTLRAMGNANQKNMLTITEYFVIKWPTCRLKENVSVDALEIQVQVPRNYTEVCRREGVAEPASCIALKSSVR